MTDVCRSVPCKLCSPGIFFDFLLSPTQKMIDGLLSFSFVACHNPCFALRDTVHNLSPGRRCIPGLPLWIASGYDVDKAFMHGHSRPVATRTSAGPGNLHGKDVHLFALRPHLSTKIAFICTRGQGSKNPGA